MYPQSMFSSKNKKNIKIFSTENFHFLQSLKSLCIAWASFRNVTHMSMTLVAWVVLVKFDRLYVSLRQHQKQNIAPPLQYHVFFKQLNKHVISTVMPNILITSICRLYEVNIIKYYTII